MNIRLLARLLGILSGLIGFFMTLSLPWALPGVACRSHGTPHGAFESEGFFALLASSAISLALGATLWWFGRRVSPSGNSHQDNRLYRKEAMAVVGLSWVLATVLGALPFVFSNTARGPSIRLTDTNKSVLVAAPQLKIWQSWVASVFLPSRPQASPVDR